MPNLALFLLEIFYFLIQWQHQITCENGVKSDKIEKLSSKMFDNLYKIEVKSLRSTLLPIISSFQSLKIKPKN